MVTVLGRFEEVLGVIRTCRSRHLEGVLDVLSDSEDEVEVHLTVFGDGSGTCSRRCSGSSPFVVDVVELDETLSNSSGAYRSGTWRIQHLRA